MQLSAFLALLPLAAALPQSRGPVEARAVDNCQTHYVDCSHNCPTMEFDEFVGAFKDPCHSRCYEDYEQVRYSNVFFNLYYL